MINVKDHKTGYLWDPWEHLGDKRRRLLDESWAGAFRKHILLQLPIDTVTPFFSEHLGRPTKELHALLGALVLQQMHDLTDKETVEQFSFNVQWHYALNITGSGDDEAYICLKTLWNARNIVAENNIDEILFKDITDHLIESFDVDTCNQRIDSVHIQSNMRHLGRIRIIASTIKKFIVNLKRQQPELYKDISEEVRNRYKSDNALSIFSLVKPSESHKTLDQVSRDLFDLCQCFKDNNLIQEMTSYGLMLRVLGEQCDIADITADGSEIVTPKPAKKITSDSLQNPSDSDATYDAHKGKGFQVQIQETWSEKEEDNENPELITHVKVEQAHKSDAHALIPAIKETKERGIAPDEMLADSLYGGDDNVEKAKLEGVEVISPAMGKESQTDIHLSAFEFSEDGIILKCPEGHKPADQKRKKTRNIVSFEINHCSNCSRCSQCPAKEGKKYYYLRFEDKEVRLARRREHEKTDAFKNRYRYRSGVEATMSEYDRITGVKHLRVRGFKAVRFCATMKALAINIRRITAAIKAGSQAKHPENRLKSDLKALIFVFKEQFSSFLTNLTNLRDRFIITGKMLTA